MFSPGTDISADIILCYKDGRTAHLITTGDCNQPNNAVIWGIKGLIEVSALVRLVVPVINVKKTAVYTKLYKMLTATYYTSKTPKFKKVILLSNT